MNQRCPNILCKSESKIILKGRFVRKSDSKSIQRFYCKSCMRNFSSATRSKLFGQNKRRVNLPLLRLLVSGVSQRRAARILNIHRITVVRKFRFLSEEAKLKNEADLRLLRENKLTHFQFDEMETWEHSKLKPLSIVLAVNPRDRKILFTEVAEMPAKGLIAKKSRAKYGKRKDERAEKLNEVLSRLKEISLPSVEILSDMNPHYKSKVLKYFTLKSYSQTKGKRGCVVGFGELKGDGFDPLFNLNHNCAMIRANINRLFRKTWCTTKKASELQRHLALYVQYHNSVLVA